MRLPLSKLAQYPSPVRIGLFILLLLLLWLPIAALTSWLIHDQNTATIVTLLLLYTEFILLVRFWGRHFYQEPNLLWRYGLEVTHRYRKELLTGLAIGVTSLFALFVTQGLFGWVVWQLPSLMLLRVVPEGLLVALGIGFAEELLFRGWLLDELRRDYRPSVALWANASTFAVLHFLRPPAEVLRTLPQFPALILLGLTLVWAKRAGSEKWQGIQRGRLALPMGLHAGLVWGYYIVNVGKLVTYSDRVPTWVTGIDRNPLAGIMGLLFLSLLAWLARRFARHQEMLLNVAKSG